MSKIEIGQPGSPDGPPVEPSKTVMAKLGNATGVILGGIIIALLGVGGLWALAWLVTHFPGA